MLNLTNFNCLIEIKAREKFNKLLKKIQNLSKNFFSGKGTVYSTVQKLIPQYQDVTC